MRRNSSSQTWNYKSTVKYQVASQNRYQIVKKMTERTMEAWLPVAGIIKTKMKQVLEYICTESYLKVSYMRQEGAIEYRTTQTDRASF